MTKNDAIFDARQTSGAAISARNVACGSRRKRLLPLIAAVAVAPMISACASPEQKMQRYTESGQEFLEKGDLGKANIQFRNALKIDEDHVPALLGLYEIVESNNQPQQMFGLLQQITRLDPTNAEALTDLSKLYLLSGDEATSLETIDAALSYKPDAADTIGTKAAILFRMGDREESIGLAERALELDPTIQEASTVVATNYILEEKPDEAIAVLDRALEANPKAAVLHLLRVQIYASQNRSEDITAAYDALIQEFPDEPAYRRLYISQLVREEKFAEARAELMEVVKLRPNETEGYIDIARLDRRIDGDEKARETLKSFADENPDKPDLAFAYAAYLRESGDADAARGVYQQVIGNAKTDELALRAKNELANMMLLDGDRSGAETLIAEILNRDARNSGGLIKTASIKLMDGDTDGAINDLRLVLADQPDSVQAKLLMASAYERRGDNASAERQYQEAFDSTEDKASVGNGFARFLIRRGDTKRAEGILSRALEVNPRNEENLKLLAAVRLQQQDWRGAEEVARMIESVKQDDAIVDRILGAAYTGLQDYAGAISVLEKMNENEPLEVNSLATLVNAYVNAGRSEEAERLLNTKIENGQDAYEANLLLANVLASQNRAEEAKSKMRSAIDLAPERPQAYERLYRLYMGEGRREDARTVLEQGLGEAPTNDGLKVLRADMHMSAGEFEEAVAIYEDILTRRPEDVLVLNNYAALVSDIRTDKASLDRAVELSRPLLETDNANFLDTHGWALVRAGRLAEGIDVLDRAVGLAPKFPDALYHLGAAQKQAGDSVAAERALKRAIEAAGSTRPDIVEKAKKLLDE